MSSPLEGWASGQGSFSVLTTLSIDVPNTYLIRSDYYTAVTLNFDEFNHDEHMRETFELAQEATARGDKPFGSVLVRDDTIIMSDSNREITEDDIRRHPELHLAYRACREYDADERAAMVMYTSTGPCPMCASGMATAGFGRVVYSVGSDGIAVFTGIEPTVRSAEILDGISEVVGPVLNDEGRRIHQEFDW
ncbi:Cytidine/deoxycytidylate deaminase, zinc-binding region (TBD) (plasmid) [Halalkalicoccus jeotgali B3]|uniref:Cytidine/deoxycytidylate deaminase, zinc-binding region (TBD) n=2 Tax=Halalkalicoccus jeotgali (strain DSM 18796 / CECT 7217 / JCM 14584 / KCTC 4019 / B3) TaxID=795797 RepID=D8JCL5_HALJB|nr:Cytidine/deoxycytidylate deaminase, zinc-binding region (TBD) [Halalkalicoccus jeotgali B3]